MHVGNALNPAMSGWLNCRTQPTLTSADEHAQTSESPNMATATPSARRGPGAAEAARRVARAGRAAVVASSRPPREHGAEGLCLGMASSHSGHLRGIGPRISNLEGS